MKNLKSKSVTFRMFFGFLLILTISTSVFGQETKDTSSTSNATDKTEENEENEDFLKFKNCTSSYYTCHFEYYSKQLSKADVVCIPQDHDCRIDYYAKQISKVKIPDSFCFRCMFYNSRAIIYYQKADYTSALNDFNFLIENRAYTSTAYLYRGKIYEKKGNYESALSDYLRVKFEEEAMLGLGNIYRNKREYERALSYYNNAISKNFRLSKAYFGRAVIYLEFGKNFNRSETEEDKLKAIQYFKDALKDLDSVIEIDLSYTKAETYLRRSQVYRQLGETEKADADFQKYNELDEAPKIKP